MQRTFKATAIAVGLLAAGCGGSTGGGASVTASGVRIAPVQSGTAVLTLFIPNRSTTSGQRLPEYIAPTTQGVSVATRINGNINSGSSKFTVVGPSSPACTPVSGGYSCAVTGPAPAGQTVFEVATWDAPTTNANPLSHGLSAPITVTAGQTVSFSVITAGIPQNAQFTPAALTFTHGVPATQSVSTVGLDADNNVITGPSYDAPIALSASSPAFAVSPGVLTGPASTAISVGYDGSGGPTSANLVLTLSDPFMGFTFEVARLPIVVQ